MTSHEILKADALDILFENRNKDYGAYILRKYYNDRLGLSLLLAIGFLSLLFLLLRFNGTIEKIDSSNDAVTLREFIAPAKKTEQPKPQKSTAQPPATKKFITKAVIVDHEVQDKMPTIFDSDALPSDHNTSGEVYDGTQSSASPG